MLVRVDAVQGNEVELLVLDGGDTFAARAPKMLWTAVGSGRWYLARGVEMAEERQDQKRSLVKVSRLDFLGVTDPRTEVERESFAPEIAFWIVSLGLLLVMSATGAWLLASYAS